MKRTFNHVVTAREIYDVERDNWFCIINLHFRNDPITLHRNMAFALGDWAGWVYYGTEVTKSQNVDSSKKQNGFVL